ncbi:DUF4493 domain-containing protein [bacterium]|nr:DUF4493 domain-containing protein [bacterium]
MKLNKGLFYSLAAAALLTGCAKEDPFVDPVYDGPTGTLMTRCLAPTLSNPEGIEADTRAAVPSTDDFKVVIARKSVNTYAGTPGSVEYKYSDMPEVLTLPADDYKVYAYHGDNKPAAWDEPYYYGESTFGIEANKITDDVEPIVAKLANIRVTIVFHPSLLSAMNDEGKVEVKVGDEGVMTFTPSESRSAYFRYVNQSQTLAATFTGTVDGSPVVQTKTHDNVAPGNHYRITFRMRGIDDDKPGNIDGNITVDASVEKVDMNHTVDGEPEEILEDDWRPTQGGGEGPGTGPEDPNPPVDTPPVIKAGTPTDKTMVPVDLDKVNEVEDNTYCVLDITSTADSGIQEFEVQIDSEKLSPEELAGVGLAAKLDLVNPGSLEGALSGLGFPVNVGGMKNVSFNITGFLPMLNALGEGTHNFILTVTDANGTTVKTLTLHTN